MTEEHQGKWDLWVLRVQQERKVHPDPLVWMVLKEIAAKKVIWVSQDLLELLDLREALGSVDPEVKKANEVSRDHVGNLDQSVLLENVGQMGISDPEVNKDA